MIGEFEIDTTVTDALALVRLTGELDLATGRKLRDAIIALADSGARTVTVDMAQLDFIDSTGLGILVGGLRRLRDHGGDLTLRSPGPNILKALEICGLSELFAID